MAGVKPQFAPRWETLRQNQTITRGAGKVKLFYQREIAESALFAEITLDTLTVFFNQTPRRIIFTEAKRKRSRDMRRTMQTKSAGRTTEPRKCTISIGYVRSIVAALAAGGTKLIMTRYRLLHLKRRTTCQLTLWRNLQKFFTTGTNVRRGGVQLQQPESARRNIGGIISAAIYRLHRLAVTAHGSQYFTQ